MSSVYEYFELKHRLEEIDEELKDWFISSCKRVLLYEERELIIKKLERM